MTVADSITAPSGSRMKDNGSAKNAKSQTCSMTSDHKKSSLVSKILDKITRPLLMFCGVCSASLVTSNAKKVDKIFKMLLKAKSLSRTTRDLAPSKHNNGHQMSIK